MINQTNLALSKRLYELDGSVEGEWWWVDCKDDPYEESDLDALTWNVERNHMGYRYYIPALTATEHLEALPAHIHVHKNQFGDYLCWDGASMQRVKQPFIGDTPADALCSMHIHLLEQGLIK